MTIVVDVSLAAGWVLPDEGGPAIDAVLRQVRVDGARVPSLFWHELRNLVVMAERRGRLGRGEAEVFTLQLRQLPIADAGPGDDRLVLALALRHRLTAYDAAYLALASTDGLPLATLDKELVAAARIEGVDLIGPLAGP